MQAQPGTVFNVLRTLALRAPLRGKPALGWLWRLRLGTVPTLMAYEAAMAHAE
jgi:hypothetical protein